MMVSPCFKCEKKNYAGGCQKGCRDHEGYMAELEKRRKEKIGRNAATSVLYDGMMKAVAEKNRRGKR